MLSEDKVNWPKMDVRSRPTVLQKHFQEETDILELQRFSVEKRLQSDQ